jgi:eukaryotic-like serine/threonine-protein kinase
MILLLRSSARIALAEGRLEHTTQGVAKGKLGYMAAEQATGGTVDSRADVFSLGCTLHALVAGDTPLAGEAAYAGMDANHSTQS